VAHNCTQEKRVKKARKRQQGYEMPMPQKGKKGKRPNKGAGKKKFKKSKEPTPEPTPVEKCLWCEGEIVPRNVFGLIDHLLLRVKGQSEIKLAEYIATFYACLCTPESLVEYWEGLGHVSRILLCEDRW
jgi:hypothetical protein